ncbi:DUF3240 family protein [Helicobacter cetorum]|uniref:DUF3240 domain-containing protein n=1 Tax=Helicobacter cetorum (strain ATCC BAA-429 / MIT 00-7128) TaxID=182217 RepID=I0EN05_HELC0|nr:DUF3240 family protein [Helicobacter cetorum]AFI04324.1 hypothetical protein HCW_05295 [Helicobacter cetorum MIT 00-7128]
MLALELFVEVYLKDTIIDFLFAQGFDDFFCTPCHKYASPSELLSQKEQVSGCKDYAKFRLFLADNVALELSQALRDKFTSKGIKLFYTQVHEL